MTRQTPHCPCCTSHPASWVRAALLVCSLTSFFSTPSACSLIVCPLSLLKTATPRSWRASSGGEVWQRGHTPPFISSILPYDAITASFSTGPSARFKSRAGLKELVPMGLARLSREQGA